jgi:hypothetical protein
MLVMSQQSANTLSWEESVRRHPLGYAFSLIAGSAIVTGGVVWGVTSNILIEPLKVKNGELERQIDDLKKAAERREKAHDQSESSILLPGKPAVIDSVPAQSPQPSTQGSAEKVYDNLLLTKREKPPEHDDVSYFEACALESNDLLTPIDHANRENLHFGKEVKWIAYFESLSITPNNEDQYFSVWADSQLGSGGCRRAFKFSHSAAIIPSLRKGDLIRFTAINNGMWSKGLSIEKLDAITIGLNEYMDALNGGMSLIQIKNEFQGKGIDWHGVVESLNFPTRDGERYRLVIAPESTKPAQGYVYAYVSADAENRLSDLKTGQKIHFSGLLITDNEIQLTGLEKVR